MLLELTAQETEDFCRFVALRATHGPLVEVREWVLAMVELCRGQHDGVVIDGL